jgi:DNA/RNA endonuclease G (NUC1)
MLNYTIGAVKKKKTAAKKKTKVSVPESFFKELKAKKKAGKKTRYPSTLPKDKTWKVTTSCSNAGTQLRKTGSTTAAGVLALCRASVKNLQVTQKALKKYAVTKGKLSRKK